MSVVEEEIVDLQSQLLCAIQERQTTVAKQMIDALASPSFLSQYPNALNFYLKPHQPSSVFLHAVAKGNAEVALYLLDKGCSLLAQTDRQDTTKHTTVAISKTFFRLSDRPGFEEVFKKVLESIECLLTDRKGNTVLHAVAKKRFSLTLKILGSSPWLSTMMKHYNTEGYRPIHLAAKSNFVEFFQLFFQHPQTFTEGDPDSGIFHHHHTSQDNPLQSKDFNLVGQRECKKLLKEEFQNFNWDCVVRDTKRTSLHIATKQESWSVVKLLVKLGANVNSLDETGKSPLSECLDHKGQSVMEPFLSELEEVCACILQAGANVNTKSNIKYSERRSMLEDDVLAPLHLAATIGAPPLLELLLNNGADPCMLSGASGKLPVQFALERGHSDGAAVLLRDGLYPSGFLASHVDYYFNTLLHSATGSACSKSVLERLLNLNCRLDRPNVNNVRPLEKVIARKDQDCVRLLLDHSPQILNLHLFEDPRCQLPLHLAASAGDTEMCRLLLAYGADIYARAYGKHRAYRRALKFERYQTALYLCEQMSQPFSMRERDEILVHLEEIPDEVSLKLKQRLENVPSLVSHCLDVVRQSFIQKYFCLNHVHSLPVPDSVIKALKYELFFKF